ncbi:MAG: DNA-formamidopyrimidine glycosylase [Calditrichia bacterium]
MFLDFSQEAFFLNFSRLTNEKGDMPELPEVETISRQIRANYLNKRIMEVEARPSRIFQNITAAEFAESLKGRILQAVKRFGKFMYWDLEDIFPVFHLGISGVFLREKSDSRYPRHIHLTFRFDDRQALYFQDVRKFSKISLFTSPPTFQELGVDPTTTKFTLNKFKQLLNLKEKNIKTFLMDQSIIAGLGNIYVNEALHRAGISPFRVANQLNEREAEQLFHSIKEIITSAIQHFGTTYTAYRTVEGNSGENQYFLKVYQKHGEPCGRCGTPIRKVVQNSRSTFYCPNCQV